MARMININTKEDFKAHVQKLNQVNYKTHDLTTGFVAKKRIGRFRKILNLIVRPFSSAPYAHIKTDAVARRLIDITDQVDSKGWFDPSDESNVFETYKNLVEKVNTRNRFSRVIDKLNAIEKRNLRVDVSASDVEKLKAVSQRKEVIIQQQSELIAELERRLKEKQIQNEPVPIAKPVQSAPPPPLKAPPKQPSSAIRRNDSAEKKPAAVASSPKPSGIGSIAEMAANGRAHLRKVEQQPQQKAKGSANPLQAVFAEALDQRRSVMNGENVEDVWK